MSESDVKEFDFASLDNTIIEEFAANPIWVMLTDETKRRLVYNRAKLEQGDIAITSADEERPYIYRTNEALRGGIIELIFALTFIEGLKEDVKEARELAREIEQQELEEQDDGT